MRHLKVLLMILCVAAFLPACNKEETIPTHPSPDWTINMPSQYEGSMSAIVTIPDSSFVAGHIDDKLSAFINGECRGIGQVVELGTNVYYMIIKANENETGQITFMYYSATNNYLYTTKPLVAFSMLESFGTADAPQELPLEVVK